MRVCLKWVCKTPIEICCHINDGEMKNILKTRVGAFYSSLLDLCYLKLFPLKALMKKKKTAALRLKWVMQVQSKLFAMLVMETSKAFRKSMVKHFYFLYLTSAIWNYVIPKLRGPYVSGLVPAMIETENIYMEMIKMFRNLLTVVKRRQLFYTATD